MRNVLSGPSPLATPTVLGIPIAAALGYVALYVVLEWVSFVHPMRGLNITPWNPQVAVAVAMLLWRPNSWWLVWITLAGAEGLVSGVPGSWIVEIVASSMLTIGYVATAAALRHWLSPMPTVATRRTLVVFLLIVAVGAVLNSLLYVGSLAAFGIPQPDRLVAAVLRGWIGDTVSLVVTLPFVLVLASSEQREKSIEMAKTRECWLVGIAAAAAAYAVFTQSHQDQFKYFYLLLLPAVWAAARFGVVGSVWSAALVQVLIIAAVQSAPYQPLTVFELHLLMAALAATGLLLGTTVDEREEADRALRASLRLAAAGDMAAALAHELNQPLTALTTYAQASQLLAQRFSGGQQSDAAPLEEVNLKLVKEAKKASEVVKRLRDFFRERNTQMQPTSLASLLGEVIHSQSAHAAVRQVELTCHCEPALPEVNVDRVQIEVVLRNLLSNAVDAASASANQPSTVSVDVTRVAEEAVFAIRDSGEGLSASRLTNLFESRISTKAGGMGIGLGISRSIVEAHGGRLWAEPGPGGRFYFSLRLPHAHTHA